MEGSRIHELDPGDSLRLGPPSECTFKNGSERVCRYIVVVDCGADPRPCFSDVGDAIRRCRIDFNTKIDLDVAPFAKGKKGYARSHLVVGTIVYSQAHAERLGWGSDLHEDDRAGFIVWL